MLTRDQWVKLRDRYKVPKGAVKGVSVGPLLEEYLRAGADLKKRLQVASKMVRGFTTYYNGLLTKNELKAFAPIFRRQLLDEAIQDEKSLKVLAFPAEGLKNNLAHVISNGRALGSAPTKEGYTKFWHSDPVRLVAMNGKRAVPEMPELRPALDKWISVLNTVIPEKLKNDTVVYNQAVKAIITAASVLDHEARRMQLYK